MAYRKAPITMTFNDLEGSFCSSKPLTPYTFGNIALAY